MKGKQSSYPKWLLLLIMVVVVGFLRPLSTSSAQDDGNLLQNGSFEVDDVSPWTGLEHAVAVNDAHDGNRALRIRAGEVKQENISVTPGQKYILTGWFKWSTFEGEDWGYDRVVIFSDDWGEIAGSSSLHDQVEAGHWTKFAISFQAETPVIHISIGIFGPQEQVDIFYDGLQLVEAANPVAPVAGIRSESSGQQVPHTVQFYANANDPDGAIQAYHWDFGDGSVSDQQNPLHTFTSRGTRLVKLTVWDNDDLQATHAMIIRTIDSASPNVRVSFPLSWEYHRNYQSHTSLTGTAASNAGENIVNVVWDNISNNSSGIVDIPERSAVNWTISTIPLKPGNNEILITATDETGRTGTRSVILQRAILRPSVSLVSGLPEKVAVYDKVELTFDVNTVASTPMFHYDPDPPPGVTPGTGVSVEGEFISPSGHVMRQPAFQMTEVERYACGEDDTCYRQTPEQHWAVRFTPQEEGVYKASIFVRDAAGTTTLSVGTFTATAPQRNGFVRVSSADPRYFEYSNGKLFWPIGPVDVHSPEQTTAGLNFTRPWLAATGAYSTNFARWMSSGKDLGNEGFDSNLTFTERYPGHDISQVLEAPEAFRLWIGWLNGQLYTPPLVEGNEYQVALRVKTYGITGPESPDFPYGLAIKRHGWPSESFVQENLTRPSLIPHISGTHDWHTVVTRFTATEDQSRSPYISVYLDNVTAGSAYIDQFSLRQVLPDGSLGGEMIVNSSAQLHSYVDQGPAAYIDDQVQAAEANGAFLKYVVHDKRDWITNHLTHYGTFNSSGEGYYQEGDTRARWYLEQWWRYLLARWGYSPAIHTWELNNEGPPTSAEHYELAQDFGQFMHTYDSHPHLVTTSFWSEWVPSFWSDNENYPDIDYADIHAYLSETNDAYDNAAWQMNLGRQVLQDNVGKPVMLGEFGIGGPSSAMFAALSEPNSGVWFHNILWSQLNPGAIYNPNYWWSEHRQEIDLAAITHPFYKFVQNLALNQGGFNEAGAESSNPSIRVIGQKNVETGIAYLWVQNTAHTWRNDLEFDDPTPITAQSGVVRLQLPAAPAYQVEWWNTFTGEIERREELQTDSDGILEIPIENLLSDVALLISIP
jgi:PKD repeat protein